MPSTTTTLTAVSTYNQNSNKSRADKIGRKNINYTLNSDQMNGKSLSSEMSSPHRHEKTVPQPVAWSPGMNIRLDPSKYQTPEKNSPYTTDDLNLSEKENVDVISMKTAPKPVAWSPSMKFSPNKSLLITPEKETVHVSKKTTADLKSKKQKNCVRFDLPASSEQLIDKSVYESPITIRGRELGGSPGEPISPVSPKWKEYSPQKSYNPHSYSDLSKEIPEKISSYHKDMSDYIPTNLKDNLNSNNNNSCTSSGIFSDVSTDLKSKERKKPKPKRSSTRNKISKSKTEKIMSSSSSIFPQDESSDVLVVRESKTSLDSNDYSYPLSNSSSGVYQSEEENVLARPEFNSTLKVRREMIELHDSKVDVVKGLQQKLSQSGEKHLEINEKASVHTNLAFEQYRDLVALEPSLKHLCERSAPVRTFKHNKSTTAADKNVPDLLEFLPADLEKELPDHSLPGIQPLSSSLQTADEETATDLYRHLHCHWSGL